MFNYDFPLSPKARTYLKFEATFNKLEQSLNLNSPQEIMYFMRSLVDYIDLVDGSGSIKIEVLKDLENCDSKMARWIDDPDIDREFVGELRDHLKRAREALDSFSRQRTVLQSDPVIESIKPRFLTPCGVNCFDTPLFTYWMRLPRAERCEDAKRWLHEMECLRIPMCTILYLWRLCADYQHRIAPRGFFQENITTCDLINIQYDDAVRGYPIVSGFQSKVNIRFMPYAKGAPVTDIEFELAYIKGSLT